MTSVKIFTISVIGTITAFFALVVILSLVAAPQPEYDPALELRKVERVSAPTSRVPGCP